MSDQWQQHHIAVEALSLQLRQTNGPVIRARNASNVSHVTRGKMPGQSNTSFRSLNNVLEINTSERYVWVEPGVTMNELAKACLYVGLIPTVLPECKEITVGGAIMGAALESASYTYGQFNDTALEYELLLADGTPKRVSPQVDSELFYGLAGSYGTLVNLTCVKIALVPAKDYVQLDYILCDSPTDFCKKLSALSTQGPDYLDGMVLPDKRIVIMKGTRISKREAPSKLTMLRQDQWWAKWFAQHVIEKASSAILQPDYLTVYDYLFRYDRGGFWMGQFVTSPGALWRHISEWHLTQPNLAESLHREYQATPPKLNPGMLWRGLLGWKLSTRSLYKVFHHLPESTRAQLYLVQDFYIPFHQVATFLDYVYKHVKITPIWLCPVRGTSTDQFLTPHYMQASSSFPQPDFVNVGLYGIPNATESVPALVHNLELRANELGGRKVLYSFNFYSPEQFWQVYSHDRYQALRDRLGANERFADFYDKLNAPELLERETVGQV